MTPDSSPLPYTDSKPVGASDFYFAINATFRFMLKRFGMEGLRKYWTDLGSRYFAPASARWKAGGMKAVADHWRAFFDAEPGAEAEVTEAEDSVVVEIKVCPALKHLRARGDILPCFCQHCYFINEAIAAPAGFTARVAGGNGSCRQTFHRRNAGVPEQNLTHIKEVTC
jgi:hypothetical protein